MDLILLLEIILIVSFEWVWFKWPSMQVGDNATRLLGFSKGSPWHLNRGDHLIQVKITVTRRKQICNFDNQSLNTGYWLNTVPLNTGVTVHLFKQMTFILQLNNTSWKTWSSSSLILNLYIYFPYSIESCHL